MKLHSFILKLVVLNFSLLCRIVGGLRSPYKINQRFRHSQKYHRTDKSYPTHDVSSLFVSSKSTATDLPPQSTALSHKVNKVVFTWFPVLFTMVFYLIHMFILSPIKSPEMTQHIPSYFPNAKGIDMLLGVIVAMIYRSYISSANNSLTERLPNSASSSSSLTESSLIHALPWRRVQESPIKLFVILCSILFCYVLTGSFSPIINSLFNIVSLSLPDKYSEIFSMSMKNNIAILFNHILWVLPSFTIMKFFIKDFFVSKPSSLQTKEANVKRYGMKRTKGSYKPLAVGGSDWFTYKFLPAVDSYICDEEAGVHVNNIIAVTPNQTTSHTTSSHSRIIIKIKRIFSVFLHSIKNCSWLGWVMGGYIMSTFSVRLIDMVFDFFSSFVSAGKVISYSSNNINLSMSYNPISVSSEFQPLYSVILGSVAPCFVGPIWEEVFYRGFVLPLFSHFLFTSTTSSSSSSTKAIDIQKTSTSIKLSTVLSSFLFALHHGQLDISFLQLLILSMIWTTSYLKSRNLFVPIFLHILWNGELLLYSLLPSIMR